MLVKTNLVSHKVHIHYIKSHSHPISLRNTEHHPVPESVKEEIKTKLFLQIPVDNIYRDLREGLADRDNRDDDVPQQQRHFITKRQIKKMQRKVSVNRRFHPTDSTSVYLHVKSLQSEKYDPILICKPQGENIQVGSSEVDKLPLSQDLFLLGFQTKEQQEVFEKFSSKIVCVDCTFGTNQYDFNVIIVMVPVAHLISNRQDELTLYYFFQVMNERCKDDIIINAVMTDDDDSGWNAFRNVFGDQIKHLLYKWHIHRSWCRRLRKEIPLDEDLRREVYQCLVVMLEEKTSNTFKTMAQSFVEKYSKDCPGFVNYFQLR